jgi:glycerate dehydrogenase
MEHVVFLDSGALQADLRRPDFDHTWTNFAKTDSSEVAERLAAATIAIVNKVPMREDALSELTCLKLIAVAATGTDIVDLAACRSRGIVVQNIRNYANVSLPEHVFALILALRRNLFAYRADVEAGLWQNSDHFCLLRYPIHDLSGSTLGLVGFGALGKTVAALGVAFGMRVLALTCVH